MAEGFEELEAMAVIDILRRAGITVVTAGAQGSIVTGSHNVRMYTDDRLMDMDIGKFDAIVLLGGSPGYQNLMRSERLVRAVEDFGKAGKLVAAICGAPLILQKAGLLKERRATAYPGMERSFDKPRSEKVVVDGNIVTSQAPGTAVEFALKLVELLAGREAALRLRAEIVA